MTQQITPKYFIRPTECQGWVVSVLVDSFRGWVSFEKKKQVGIIFAEALSMEKYVSGFKWSISLYFGFINYISCCLSVGHPSQQ